MKRTCLLAALILVSACHPKKIETPAQPAAPQPAPGRTVAEPPAAMPAVPDARDYAVYSAALKDMFPSSSMFVIGGDTWPNEKREESLPYLRENLKLFTEELWADYLKQNDQPYLLERRFDLPDYRLLSTEELNAIFARSAANGREDYWQGFADEFPGAPGMINVSRVGYSPDGKTAFVYVGHTCGPLCGTGHDLILVLEKGKWKVRERAMLWIS